MGSSASPGPYAVFPTQPWQMAQPIQGVEHIQAPSLQGSAALGNQVYIFTTTSNNQVYMQTILVETSESSGWSIFLQGMPTAQGYDNNPAEYPIIAEAPPVAVTLANQIFVFFALPNSENLWQLWQCRFNGAAWAPEDMILSDQSILANQPPGVAVLGNNICLVWPGSGKNGYFCCIGTLGQPDDFGPTISWGESQVIPGTQDWISNYGPGTATVSAFQAGTSAAGFLIFAQWKSQHIHGLFYAVYDLNSGTFGPSSDIPFAQEMDSQADEESQIELPILTTSLVASDSLVVPVCIDASGNIAYYQLSNSAPSFGTFAPFLQCAIGGSGGGVGLGVSVGIPPSIAISGNLDSSPPPDLGAATIVSGSNGGALICSQFNDPAFGDNSIGFAAVALNLQADTD